METAIYSLDAMKNKTDSLVAIEWDEEVALLTLQRPDALNALDPALLTTLLESLDTVCAEKARAVVLTGAGRAFSAGGDLRWFDANAKRGVDHLARAIPALMEDEGNPVIQALHGLPVPLIAAVNGPCVGGALGMALVADVVFAARSAYFLLPQVSALGIVPDLGASWVVARLLGRGRASGFALLGEKLNAAEAEQWGLVWRCVEDDKLLPFAMHAAKRLAKVPARAVLGTRTLLDSAASSVLASQLAAERQWQRELVVQPYFRDACTDFCEPTKDERRAGHGS